jgi:steroid delta-isomerase
MPTPIEAVVTEYFAAIRAMDVERCVAVFAPDAEQQDPVGAPPNFGHDAIRTFFTQIFSGFKLVDLTEDGPARASLAMESPSNSRALM